MAIDDSAELLDTIKTRGSIPVNSGTWTDAKLLKAASDAIVTVHLPMLVAAKGEYLVKESLIPMVQGQKEYRPSYRAAGNGVRQLAIQRADGHELPIEELKFPGQSPMALDRNRQGTPRWFWFRENYFGVWPLPDSEAANFVARWHMRPNRIVVTTDAKYIINVTPEIVPGQTRLAWSGGAPAALASANALFYDIVGRENPFPIKAWDLVCQTTITEGVTTNANFLSSALPSDLAAGDWLCQSQQTPYPNVPVELHIAAALRAAASAVGSRNSSMKRELIREAEDEEKRLLRGLLEPRSKGNIQRIVTTRWRRR